METPISLEAARSFNTVGAATLIIPDYIDRRSLRKNTRMRLWRRGLDGTTRSFGDTEWFLRKIRHSYNDQTYTLEFEDALSLLAFRLVAYTSETPYADKTLEEFGLIVPDDSLRIDNMMRAYVRENYGALALDANRINSLISIEEDKNLGPYGDQKASWKLLSDTLSGLANMSAEKGLELFYDFVPQPDGTFMFKVWDKIRNVDRGSDSFSILTLSEELNHLTEVEEIEDYSEIGTYAYVLGYDSGPSQIIVERSNDLEIANDPFGRIEFTEEAPDIDVDRVLENIGDAALRGKRPKRTVSARVVEGTGIVYGRDYNYGDRVLIHVGTRKYNCHVKAVRTRWAEGQEDLEVRLDGYEEDAFPTFPNIPAEDENVAPVVDAGPDQEIGGGEIDLSGSATDDGLPDPPSALTYLWTKISGPGTVVFGDATNPVTTAILSVPGVYVLRLTANDSDLTGFDELTVTIEESTFTPPLPGDPSVYYGDMAAYIIWNQEHIGRTWDLQAASPVWENIGSTTVPDFTGDIEDLLYMHVDENTVGVWLLTTDGVWFCPDIMAANPSWVSKLTLATVIAADAAPAVGTIMFGGMFHYWSLPGHLIVTTTLTNENDDYLHAYFWVTEDYGANWTQVDMNMFTFTSDSATRCYYTVGKHSMNVFRSAPGTIWCMRANGRTGTGSGDTAVFKSVDLGYTWTKEHLFPAWTAAQNLGGILNPFPSIGDPSYLGRAGTLSSVQNLYISEDAWATATLTAKPVGYTNLWNFNRVNKRTFDQTHVIALWRVSTSGDISLFESFDKGATWILLEAALNARSVPPNGWPPDVDQWVLINSAEDGSAGTIRLTLDNFATLLDKSGNLDVVMVGGWAANTGDGFALPRVAPND